nr:hypothetical protein [Tanacetum cinerariifolium]
MIDYSLWEVILNGDSPTPTRVIDSVVQAVAPTTTEQRLAKKNELKARGTLLMALPDKHQLKFNIYKDAKSLMDAFEKRVGGNKETKKMQNTLLKQHSSESVSVVPSVSTASTKPLAFIIPNVDNLSDAVIYSFFTSQSNSPQLDNDDLKQIDADDLEEIDLKWQLAMLTIRARRFLQQTGRNLGANGTTFIGFDMSKVECYNCHRRGHFARECRSLRETRNKDTQRRNVPADEEPTHYASWNLPPLAHQVLKMRKSQFDVLSYKSGLESVEARLNLGRNLKKLNKERDELQHTLVKFQTSSKNLSKLLESQITDKIGLGYDNQVFNSTVFDYDELNSSESDVSVPTSLVHDWYKSDEGYHTVPPPYIGTFMPSKPDLVFHDDPIVSETVPNVFNVEPSTTKPTKELSQSNRPSTPIIEDWVFDSEDESKEEYARYELAMSTVKSTIQVPTYGFTSHFFNQSQHTLKTPLDKKDSSFDEILDDLFRIGEDNIRNMEHEVPNRCDDETVYIIDYEDSDQEDGELPDLPTFPATNVFSSIFEQ